MYEYNAKITNVVDGDTMDFEIDLGFGIIYRNRLRLFGVNTPEIKGKERKRGLEVTEKVRELIEGKEVILRTHKWKGKYGRFVAHVFFQKPGSSKAYESLTEYLIKQNMGIKVDYD